MSDKPGSSKDGTASKGEADAGSSSSGKGKKGKITGCFVKVSKEEYLQATSKINAESVKKEEETEVKEEVKEEKAEEASRPRPEYKAMDVAAEVDDQDEDPDFEQDSGDSGKRKRKCAAQPAAKRQKAEKKKVEKCQHCRQPIEDPDKLVFYGAHPNGARQEYEVLFDPMLAVDFIDGSVVDERPDYRLTQFTFYDREGHVVPFAEGLLERNSELLFSGYVKPVYDDSPNTDGGVAICDGGPMVEWWTAGFDGGEKHLIGISTEMANYYLTEPTPEYKPFMEDVDRKVFITKLIVERLMEARETMEMVEHEDLLHMLEGRSPPGYDKNITNDDLVKYSDYIVNAVYSYEEAGDTDEDSWMMETPCIREIITISGLKRNKVKGVRIRKDGATSAAQKMKKAVFTKATTTPLVRFVFESFFKDQIADDGKKMQGPRKRRCGKCDGCLAPNCTKCAHCLDMKQYGGKGTGKQACIKRKCESPIEALDNIQAEEEDYFEGDEEVPKNKSVKKIKDEDEDGDSDDEKENNKNKKSGNRRSSGSNKPKGKGNQKSAADFFKPKRSTEATKGAKIKWCNKDSKFKQGNKTYYDSAEIDGEIFNRGDFGLVYYDDGEGGRESYIRRVAYFYESEEGQRMAHVHRFTRSCDTLLADAADPQEIFQELFCENVQLANFGGKISAVFWPVPDYDEFVKMGGTEEAASAGPPLEEGQEGAFFFRLRHDGECSRFEFAKNFEKAIEENKKVLDYCAMCEDGLIKKRRSLQVVQAIEPTGETDENKGAHLFKAVQTMNEVFRVNDAVFFTVSGGTTKSSGGKSRDDDSNLEKRKREVDEEKYPEFYRKTERVKGSNENIGKPFGIGIITEILSYGREGKRNIKLKVRKMYRPENTSLTQEEAFAKDLNMVYWSNEIISVDLTQVRGRCYLKNEDNIDEGVSTWTRAGEYRFYYNMAYDRQKRSFEELPSEADRYGRQAKGGGKGKGKGKKSTKTESEATVDENNDGAYPWIKKPLACLDVFAGCGGLSLGLHQAGVADSKWAIEVFEPAANAYKMNNPNCEVFTDDCNLFLKQAIDGEEFNSRRQRIPVKKQVEMLVGGPPCQGFSGMNRFNHREYSQFKNSLCSSFLSFCDFYRPKYFILENVRNFATFKKSAVLRLCLKALLKMGYSCTFAILQAGHYGVAQTRRRAILLAAAPGETLPYYPEPQHVFATTPLSAQVGEKTCVSNSKWVPLEAAPYRTITVRDCMSDLPEIPQGQGPESYASKIPFHGQEVTSYNSEPRTHFQKQMRRDVPGNRLMDHITKVMSALVEARMALIPTVSGSDWRDLPNIVMKLADGTYTEKLVYNYADYQKGKSSTGALRGVCACMAGKHKQCNPDDKQTNTIIPWCLPHTSNRHNQWAGLYGRLEYDGFFSTTVTNPEPMGKQGRVLHPEQDRLVSVRECARSQGFPDWYRFYGSVLDRHRQVGNAVAPPMGYYLGLEVRKAMAKARKEMPEKHRDEVKEEVVKKEEAEEEDADVEDEEKELIKMLVEEDEKEAAAAQEASGGQSSKPPISIDSDSD